MCSSAPSGGTAQRSLAHIGLLCNIRHSKLVSKEESAFLIKLPSNQLVLSLTSISCSGLCLDSNILWFSTGACCRHGTAKLKARIMPAFAKIWRMEAARQEKQRELTMQILSHAMELVSDKLSEAGRSRHYGTRYDL